MPETRFSLAQFSSRIRILSTWIIVGGRICRPAGFRAERKYSLVSSVPWAYSLHMKGVITYSTGLNTSPFSRSLMYAPSIVVPLRYWLILMPAASTVLRHISVSSVTRFSVPSGPSPTTSNPIFRYCSLTFGSLTACFHRLPELVDDRRRGLGPHVGADPLAGQC